jgi:hypothetical protein
MQRCEGNGSNDKKEYLRAQPDDEREIKERAEKSLHGNKNTREQGTGNRE